MKKAMKIIAILLIVALVAIPVYAAIAGENFTPSISQKGAPRMMRFRNPETGEEFPAVIVDEAGEVVAYVEESGIEITPLSEIEIVLEDGTESGSEGAAEGATGVDKHVEEMLLWGYNSLYETDLAEAIEGLEDALKEREVDLTAEDLVVYELFHISLSDEYTEYLKAGNKLMVKLEQLNKNIDFEMVIHATNKDNEWVANAAETESLKWYVLSEDVLAYGEEGERILTIEEGCLYGLITDKKD